MLAVTLRTTAKIVRINEFERKLPQPILAKVAFLSLPIYVPLFFALCTPFLSAAVELTCIIDFASTYNLRIEWKKIKNGIPSYVYYRKKIVGKLTQQAEENEKHSERTLLGIPFAS